MIDQLLVGKTGTLTKGEMKVSKFWAEGHSIKNTRKNTLTNCQLAPTTLQRIYDSMLYNCEARVEMDATSYIPTGNSTEVAFMKFLQDADLPIHRIISQKYGTYDSIAGGRTERKPLIKAISPFNSTKKRSAIAMVHPLR